MTVFYLCLSHRLRSSQFKKGVVLLHICLTINKSCKNKKSDLSLILFNALASISCSRTVYEGVNRGLILLNLITHMAKFETWIKINYVFV